MMFPIVHGLLCITQGPGVPTIATREEYWISTDLSKMWQDGSKTVPVTGPRQEIITWEGQLGYSEGVTSSNLAGALTEDLLFTKGNNSGFINTRNGPGDTSGSPIADGYVIGLSFYTPSGMWANNNNPSVNITSGDVELTLVLDYVDSAGPDLFCDWQQGGSAGTIPILLEDFDFDGSSLQAVVLYNDPNDSPETMRLYINGRQVSLPADVSGIVSFPNISVSGWDSGIVSNPDRVGRYPWAHKFFVGLEGVDTDKVSQLISWLEEEG